MMWRLVFTKQAKKDARKIAHAGLKPHVESLLEILRDDPYRTPPPYEKLVGDLSGACSRRHPFVPRAKLSWVAEPKGNRPMI